VVTCSQAFSISGVRKALTSILIMVAGTISETLDYAIVTWLIAREDFTARVS
jgi:hypothetical protein